MLVVHGFQVLVKNLASTITTDCVIQNTLPIGIIFFHYKFEINFIIFGGNFHQILQYHKIERKNNLGCGYICFWECWWDLGEPPRTIVQCEIFLIQQCCKTFDLCNESCVSYFRQNEMLINLVFTSWLENGFKFNCYHFYSLNNSLWDEFIYLFLYLSSLLQVLKPSPPTTWDYLHGIALVIGHYLAY